MKKICATLALTALLIPGMALAAPAHKMAHSAKAHAAVRYECAKCHMTYSAADAKKDHYKCPMDGGKLAPQKKSASGSKKMM